MDAETVRSVLGAILVLVGLYLVITGAPAVATTGGFTDILKEIFSKYPRVGIGVVFIIIGGMMLGATDLGDLFGAVIVRPDVA